jgi:hypothetical protein
VPDWKRFDEGLGVAGESDAGGVLRDRADWERKNEGKKGRLMAGAAVE